MNSENNSASFRKRLNRVLLETVKEMRVKHQRETRRTVKRPDDPETKRAAEEESQNECYRISHTHT